jgi:hypothetical protein
MPTTVCLTRPTAVYLTSLTDVYLTRPTAVRLTRPTDVYLTRPTTVCLTRPNFPLLMSSSTYMWFPLLHTRSEQILASSYATASPYIKQISEPFLYFIQ